MSAFFSFLIDASYFLISHIIVVNIILSAIVVFFNRKNPTSVWAWLLVLNALPVVGFIVYLFVGLDLHKVHLFRSKEVEDRLEKDIRRQKMMVKNQDFTGIDEDILQYADLALYHLQTGGALLSADNEIRFFTEGTDKFESLKEDLRNAKSSIHIQYYIIRNDEVFEEIHEILKEKVKEGVEVRILYDYMGCYGLSALFWRKLEKEGIQRACFFSGSLGKLTLRMNYRNHRKIVVIDNKIGYVGGFNVAREYIGKSKKFGHWRDTHMRIVGTAVNSLQIRFILDWNFSKRSKSIEIDPYISHVNFDIRDKVPMQIISSGPDSKDQYIRNTYLRMIQKAKKSIYIQTPYFILDDALTTALIMALNSGITVNLMIPCKPDHPFVYWATISHAGELIMEGANCYIYDDGFLHAKGMIVDDTVLCYGTANMDIRSFALDFEVNALIYDKKAAKEMVEAFEKDALKSHLLTKEKYAKRGLIIRFRERVDRLLSPLL